MNLFKAVVAGEVFPALGCTEPIAVAYTASEAAKRTCGELRRITIHVDPGVYKNGMAVTVPNTGGERGNLIAGVLGALIGDPERKMEILDLVRPEMIDRAKAIIRDGNAQIRSEGDRDHLYIEVVIETETETVRAVVEYTHTRLTLIEKDGRILFREKPENENSGEKGYHDALKRATLSDLVDLAEAIDADDERYLREGIEMNLRMSEAGKEIKRVGYYLTDLMSKGFLLDDVFSSSKILTGCATDARMAGTNLPVMSSGGSGNQGIVASLVPYNVGKWFKISEARIIRSVALSHLINSYVKCFTGSLSPICGCAIAAGVGAATAIVYQQKGKAMAGIALAVNNVISDLGGMLCDGAKSGCALKVVSATDSAIRSAYMALNDHGITSLEGFVGRTPEETIQNLSRISRIGMAGVDGIMLEIMAGKSADPDTPDR